MDHTATAHDPGDPGIRSAAPTPNNGLGIASLVLGIVALIGAFIPVINYVSVIVAFVGVVLGVVAIFRRNRRRGFAIAGSIVSFVALILSAVLAFVYSIGFMALLTSEYHPPRSDTPSASPAPGDSTPGDSTPGDSTPGGGDGTLESPAAIGSTLQIGATTPLYEVTLGAPDFDATDAVLAADTSNQTPADGMRYVTVPVTLTYVGDATGTPLVDVRVHFDADSGVTYRDTDTAALAPEPRFQGVQLAAGETATGTAVLLVSDADAGAGLWSVRTGFGDPVYFAGQ